MRNRELSSGSLFVVTLLTLFAAMPNAGYYWQRLDRCEWEGQVK